MDVFSSSYVLPVSSVRGLSVNDMVPSVHVMQVDINAGDNLHSFIATVQLLCPE